MVVCLVVAAPGDAEPRTVYVAQHAHASFALHASSSAAHAEETASVDWPAVLPTKGAGFLAFALKGFALRLDRDGSLRAYLPGALQPALAAGGYRIDGAVADADGSVAGGRLQYRPKLRKTATGGRARAAIAAAADASAHAMRTLQEHAGAVQPLPYGDVEALKQRLAEAHPDVTVLDVAVRDATTVASIAAARAQQLAARAAWHAGAAGEATAHLRAAQRALSAAAAATPAPSCALGKRRRPSGSGPSDELARLNGRLLAAVRRVMFEAATLRMWQLMDDDWMREQWGTATWLKFARSTRLHQLDRTEAVFLRCPTTRGQYTAAAKGDCAVAALAATEPCFVDGLLQLALANDATHCGPGGAAARLAAVDYFRSGRKALKAEGTTPELLRIADTPLDALAYAQVVVLLFVLCQAAADAGRVLKEWEDHVLASLNGAEEDEPARY